MIKHRVSDIKTEVHDKTENKKTSNKYGSPKMTSKLTFYQCWAFFI